MSRTIAAVLHAPGEAGRALTLSVAGPPASTSLVSCLMVSRGRLFPAMHAVECFRRQTHAHRELVVVTDAPGSELAAHLRALGDARIRLIELAPAQRTLGELRNLSVASAAGEYVCQWDDDDLYAPERIATQLAALLETGASACTLRRWALWWPDAGRLARSGARTWEGSLLARKEVLPSYPALRRGEDTAMMERLVARECMVSLDAPDLYVYVHHRGNTFGLAHFVSLYNHSRLRWVGAQYHEQLAALDAVMPLRAYEADLRRVAPAAPARPRDEAAPAPLVTIVVRSMGRPHLRGALESLAAQDYPSLDIVVVDATGGRHPPLPQIGWRDGHRVRMVSGTQPLTRPQAANAGLDAMRGAWFGFLDDDDTFDPDHVSTLMTLAAETDDLVIYGLSRLVGPDGETTSVFGLPFNRATVVVAPLCAFPAALFDHRIVGHGCRFDERLEIFEDQDFFAQASMHSGFARSPIATFNYHVEAGTSGTGQGANRDWVRGPRFEQRLRAKWAGEATYHVQRMTRVIARAVEAFRDRDPRRARTLLQSLLVEYPDEPNALNGLGFLCLDAGDFEGAQALLRRAVDINPTAGEYRLNLARALEGAGHPADARREASVAATDARVREAARRWLAGLADSGATAGADAATAMRATRIPRRVAACPCGSGKRFKHCCGDAGGLQRMTLANVAAATPAPGGRGGPAYVDAAWIGVPQLESPADLEARRAIAAFRAGEAVTAMNSLTSLAVSSLTCADTALACGDLCRDMLSYEHAITFYGHAATLGETFRVSTAVAECCSRWYRPQRDAAIAQRVLVELQALASRHAPTSPSRAAGPIHIVGALGKLGGSEHRALALHAALSAHAPTHLWSTVPPLRAFRERHPVELIDEAAGRFPRDGHLVFVGTYFEYGHWLERCRPHRITLCYNIELPETLVARLVALRDIGSDFALDITFPSRTFRDVAGLHGPVEYAPVDLERFRPPGAKAPGVRPLVIGRHSRDDSTKFHPDDPSFYRRLVREGHRVEVVGGTCLRPALAADVARGGIVLHGEGAPIVPFLQQLDCFLYRGHPQYFEAGGTVLEEAMAMALPVIVFGDRVGMAELIEHGRNGYLVQTEAQALAHVRALQRDPELRRAIGEAARATMVETMRRQRAALVEHYLPWLETEAAHDDASIAAADPPMECARRLAGVEGRD